MRYGLLLLSALFLTGVSAQEPSPYSVHMEESLLYGALALTQQHEFDSVNRFSPLYSEEVFSRSNLTKTVFGYYPYWGGSNYLNYRWELLSDLCYFSYEVDPYSGLPLTTHGWSTAAVIDSAHQNGVAVHLCVTLFSSHGIFFSSSQSQLTLISTVINMLQTKNAKGVNIDFEAMSSVYRDQFTAFIADLSLALKNAIPGAVLSIASPAVNWSETFDIASLGNYIDFFMVMSYDYYWNGSAQAGPVGGLYSMTSGFDYNLSRTLSYYQGKGIDPQKIVAGMPYYGRQWPVQYPEAPSAATGSGIALTYSNIRDNASGYYSPLNKKWEPNSFSPYYSFYASGWNHCFIDDPFSLGKKYDIVNRRDLAGIGIWALGYDNGYQELWDLIAQKFTAQSAFVESDSVFDSGGPAWNYYSNEEYSFTLRVPEGKQISLEFTEFSMEEGFDSLWVFDGPHTGFPLVGAFSGDGLPAVLQSTGSALCLHFYSDAQITRSGWKAYYQTIPVTIIENITGHEKVSFNLFPIPSDGELFIRTNAPKEVRIDVSFFSCDGKRYPVLSNYPVQGDQSVRLLPTGNIRLPQGLSVVEIVVDRIWVQRIKVLLTSSGFSVVN